MKRHFLTACMVLILAAIAIEAKCADVVKPAALYLSLSAADLGSTAWAERNGASEGNPYMDSHRIEKQVLMAAALTAIDVRLKGRGRKRALRIAVTAIRVGAMAWNVRNARRTR